MTRTVFQPSAVLTAAFVFFISFSSSQARELPHGPGLAAQYTGDAGIDTNQAVVFFEDFEDASLENLPQRWDHISNENNDVLYYVRDVPDRSAGTMSLQMKASRGSNTGGHLFKVFRPGYDELYIRFY
ncbi:MAG: hypothetical protein U9N45_04705, partial [Gemmatimonadota bacterium]|nr:hypothetical protein [Gemmatimonadota bacterium]